MRILIVGCGYVGSELARLAVERGDEVAAVTRRGSIEVPNARAIAADVTTGAGIEALPREVDALVYAVSPGERSEGRYRAVYVDGLRRILEATSASRNLLITSTAVYGQDAGEVVDETSATEPQTFSGRLLLEGERLLLDQGARPLAVRASGIYGPGRTSLIERVRTGAAVRTISPVWTNRIHRDDLARALLHLIDHREHEGSLIVTDDTPAPLNDLLDFIADSLGVPHPGAAESGGSVTRLPSGPRNRSSRRCSNARLRQLGFRCTFPSYREGYGELMSS